MEITSDTYWYVKKFLAHKIAFEPAISGPADVTLVTVDVQERKTLHDLAKELQVDENDLLAYNLWMRKNNIPGDKTYTLIVPVKNNQQAPVLAAAGNRLPTAEHAAEVTVRSTRNGIPVIVAGTSDTWATLAAKTGVSLRQLLRYNDCTIADPVIAGNFYYTKPKKNRTEIPALHVVQPGQSLWAVSQQYGIALKKLQRLNPAITGTPAAGTTVYLVSIPRHVPAPEQVAQVDAEAPFAWAAGETPKVVAVPTEIPALPRDNAPAQPQATTPKDMHRVEAGQTLYGIARSYNLTPADLLAWNNLTVTEPLKPGQLLRLSPPEKMHSPQAENHTAAPHSAAEVETNKTSAGFIVYEVKPADTLYSIARQHGVTIKELMEWNGKKDFAVTPGEKLKIAPK
jgi:membrane-bound lytic murein transglycosylase D